jgi:hypothetical protein
MTISRSMLLNFFLSVAAGSTVSGCDWFAVDEGGQVNVFTAHHGTAVSSAFPSYGAEGISRVFTNDLGWTIRLTEAYVTTKNVELVACNGGTTDVSLYWGPWAEDIIAIGDTLVQGIGGVTSEPSSFCSVRVSYQPFYYNEITTAGGENTPSNAEMDGQTVLLSYVASLDGNEISGTFTTQAAVIAEIDTASIIDDGPIKVAADQRVPVEITLSKTYDKFFEGIDFLTATDADIEASVLASLEMDSKATIGTYLLP